MMQMNKKGIAPALLIPLAIAIVIIVVGIGAFIGILASNKMKLLAGGATIIVLTIIYGLQGNFNKDKGKFMLFLIAGGIVLILLSSTSFFPQVIYGAQTLSLSNVDLTSSNPFFTGKAWLISFAAGGLGQSYYGSFAPATVDQFTDDSTTTAKTFTLEATYDTQECQYDISQTYGTPVKKVRYGTYGNLLYTKCDVATAQSKGFTNVLYAVKPSGSIYCYVISEDKNYPVGDLATGDVYAPYTLTLNAGGQTATKRIDPSTGSTGGPLGTIGYATWTGNLVSGKSCKDSSIYYASYVENQWRVISEDRYNNYKTKYLSFPQVALLSGSQPIIDWINQVNSYADAALSTQSFGTISNAASINDAVVKLPLDSPLQFPVTSLYIKADTIGIYTPSPTFAIASASSPQFTTGSNGYIDVSVKNTGTETGTFTAFAECVSPFSATSNYYGSATADQTVTFKLPVSATTKLATQSGSCVVKVESVAGTVSKYVTMSVKGIPTCTTPYPAKYCKGNALYQCAADGMSEALLQTCSTNQVCSVNECKDKSIIGDIIDIITPDIGEEEPIPIIGPSQEELDCKAKAGSWQGYQWIETTTNPAWYQELFGAKATTTGYCNPTNMPYVTIAVIVIALGTVLIVVYKPKRRKK